VQLSIFLIDLFVGTYRLSSHARLEAFVIQTKLNYPIIARRTLTSMGIGFRVYGDGATLLKNGV